jgi:AraC-like DNA-binding protein
MSREIRSRKGIGAVGTIVQACEQTLYNLAIADPCVIMVELGTKRMTSRDSGFEIRSSQALAIWNTVYLDVTNLKADSGFYQASWIAWDRDIITKYVLGRMAKKTDSKKDVVHIPKTEKMLKEAFARACEGISDETVPAEIAAHRMLELLMVLDAQDAFSPPGADIPLSWRLRKMMNSDPSYKWRISDMTRAVGMSESTLRRRLADEKMNVAELITDVRMSHALALLQSTDMTVTRIASEAGYDCVSRFTARFRHRFGFTPSSVRGQR